MSTATEDSVLRHLAASAHLSRSSDVPPSSLGGAPTGHMFLVRPGRTARNARGVPRAGPTQMEDPVGLARAVLRSTRLVERDQCIDTGGLDRSAPGGVGRVHCLGVEGWQ